MSKEDLLLLLLRVREQDMDENNGSFLVGQLWHEIEDALKAEDMI